MTLRIQNTAPIAAALLIGAASLAPPPDAEACSPPQSYLEIEAPTGDPLVSPLEGLIVLEVRGFDAVDGVFEPEADVEVLTDDDAPVPGQHTWRLIHDAGGWGNPDLFLLIWRADAPLTAGTTYRAHVTVKEPDSEPGWGPEEATLALTVTPQDEALPFDPAAHTLDPDLNPSASLTLDAHWTATSRTCCVATYDCVGHCSPDFIGDQCAHCWASDYAWRPVVSSALDLDPRFARRVLYTVTTTASDGASRTAHRLAADLLDIDAFFSENADSYCVSLTATDLLSGEVVESDPWCVNHDAMPELEPRDEPDHSGQLSSCAEPPDDDGTEDDPGDDGDEGGDDDNDDGMGNDDRPGDGNNGGMGGSVGDDGVGGGSGDSSGDDGSGDGVSADDGAPASGEQQTSCAAVGSSGRSPGEFAWFALAMALGWAARRPRST